MKCHSLVFAIALVWWLPARAPGQVESTELERKETERLELPPIDELPADPSPIAPARTADALAPAPMAEMGETDPEMSLLLEDLAVLSDLTTKSKPVTVRHAIGVVTILTREEILRSGARDLVDVLALVPGFALNLDSFSMIYSGFRGMWGTEGKVLFLLDGHEMNDLLYLSTPLGNRFPVDQLEKVEIIRGPGSVMYGGAAEFAVVKLTTRSAAQLNGFSGSAVYGQMFTGADLHDQSLADSYGHRNLDLSYGRVFGPGGDASARIHLFLGQGNRSDLNYTDTYGSAYNMTRNARTDPFMVNLAAQWRGLKLGYLFENYRTTMRDGYAAVTEEALPSDFLTSSLWLAYDWQLLSDLQITPTLRYVYSQPFKTTDERARNYDDEIYWDPNAQRAQASVRASWRPLANLDLLGGLEYTQDWALDREYQFADPDAPDDPDQRLSYVSYGNIALYGQGLFQTRYVDVAAGVRYEQHTRFGGSFVPRASLNKTFGDFHFKLLVSQAFRAPSIQDLANNPELKPERTTTFELELGYQLGKHFFVAVNGFDTTVREAIVYFYELVSEEEGYKEGYRNEAQTGTRGCELELRFRAARAFANLSYSFYDAAGKNEVETFSVPGKSHVLLGFSPHKLALRAGYDLLEKLSLNLSALLLSDQRYGYTRYDGNAELTAIEDFGPSLTLNANLLYRDLFWPGFFAQLGVANLQNDTFLYIQPYNNSHAPMPARSREIFLKLGFDLSI